MLNIQPLKVFISYSHKDEDLKEELEVHLATLVRRGKISSWQDRTLEAGIEWEPQIQLALQTADILLLLISPRFMASDYINDVELKAALERHRSGTARVIPIILRHVDWYGTDIAALVSLPKNGKPITTWDDQDEAFKDVVQELRKVVESLQSIKYSRSTTGPAKTILPVSNPHCNQRPQSFNTQPNRGKPLSRHRGFPSRTENLQRSAPRCTSRTRSNPSQRSRSYISEIVKVARGSWCYCLPILILWVVIGFYQQEVGDLSGKREMLGFLCLGALGGFLTGIVTSLAWQNFSQSRFQVDALLLWSLIGLIVGGLLWILVYFLFGTRFILTQGTRIGFGLALIVVFILLWQIKAQITKDTHW